MKKIFIAGHKGMVGSAIVRELLISEPQLDIVTATRDEVDLTRQEEVEHFMNSVMPDQVYIAAAKVGGIHANESYPAEFITNNLLIDTNLIYSAFKSGVKKLLFLGSSCIYPKNTKQPMIWEEQKTKPRKSQQQIDTVPGLGSRTKRSVQTPFQHQIEHLMPETLDFRWIV